MLERPVGLQQQEQEQQQQQHHAGIAGAGRKTGNLNLLGQVWEGFRGRLRLRRDAGAEQEKAARRKAAERRREVSTDRPTREEAMTNYHQLVASGFFSAHAIQSTRQPGPTITATPPSRREGQGSQQNLHLDEGRDQDHQQQDCSKLAPPWPLAHALLTPGNTRPSSPICSPTSASSRGTKRMAGNDFDDDDGSKSIRNSNDYEGEKRGEATATLEESTPMRKIRKIASRDFAFPKLRSVTSRRNLLSRRSVSATVASPLASPPANNGNNTTVPPREPNKLTKRPPVSYFAAARGSLDGPRRTASTSSRSSTDGRSANVSVSNSQSHATRAAGVLTSGRVLRARHSLEALCVVPDANRGIPRVPAIPAKFAFSPEDRENAQPLERQGR